MSSTPSKSEIELALSGKQRQNLQRQRNARTHNNSGTNPKDFELESRQPRRSQVLGGDLTGVSGRGGKKTLLQKLSGLHMASWIAVAVVISILVAFFWPNNSSEGIREIAEQKTNKTAEPFYSDSRIDEIQEMEVITSKIQTFSRDNDFDRALEYREAQQADNQIKELLSIAQEQLEKKQFITPKNNNALTNFKQILVLDSKNSDALSGINSIKSYYLKRGQSAINKDDAETANKALNILESIETNSTEFNVLSNELAVWQKNTEIDQLLKNAADANEAQRTILPANNSSLYYYRKVLALDENNSVANKGIEDISESYITRANASFMKGDLEAATGYLATASVIDSENPSIEIVRKMITSAEPIAAEANAARDQEERQNTITNNEASSTSDETVFTDITESSPLPSVTDTSTQQANNNITDPNRVVSSLKTPFNQTDEQEEFDQIYLSRGLDAYYQGDYQTASALLKPLADKGISRAQFRIGYMYYLGRGVKKDRVEADRVVRAALPAVQKFANEGRSWAQSDIGSLYEDGLVLPRDYAEAIYWYRSAAQQGYAGAQTNLGIMYARGRGVTASRKTAIQWFQRAAAQGDIAAQRNLESLGVN